MNVRIADRIWITEKNVIAKKKKQGSAKELTDFLKICLWSKKMDNLDCRYRRCNVFSTKDLEKYHASAERILNALDKSSVPISWNEIDRYALQSVIAKELILIEKEERK